MSEDTKPGSEETSTQPDTVGISQNHGRSVDETCAVRQYQWADPGYQAKWNKVLSYCSEIMEAAETTGLDPLLIATVIFVESGGNPDAISKSGAVGLMQIMPRDGIAANRICINGPCFANRPSIEELKDPAFNISWGSNYLSGLINQYGEHDGLFKYGPMDVGYWYADLVLDLYYRIRNN